MKATCSSGVIPLGQIFYALLGSALQGNLSKNWVGENKMGYMTYLFPYF